VSKPVTNGGSDEITEVIPVVELVRPVPKPRTRLHKPQEITLDESFQDYHDQFHSDGDEDSFELVAHFEQPHIVGGVQADDPQRLSHVEAIATIGEPAVEHVVHRPLQDESVGTVQRDAPSLRSSTRKRTVPKWHNDYVVSSSHIVQDDNGGCTTCHCARCNHCSIEYIEFSKY